MLELRTKSYKKSSGLFSGHAFGFNGYQLFGEVMYDSFVNDIKSKLIDRVLTELKSTWLSAWLVEQEPEIKKKTLSTLVEEQATYDASRRAIQATIDQKNMRIARLKRGQDDVFIDELECDIARANVNLRMLSPPHESSIRYRIVDEYTSRCNRTVWPSVESKYKTLLDTQLDAFEPERILKQLLQRHPWLKLDAGGFADDFLSHLLSKSLVSCRLSPRFTSEWSGISIELLRQADFRWKEIDSKELKKHIEGYPLSNVFAFYNARTCYNYKSVYSQVLSAEHTRFSDVNVINHQLTRIDLFRLLWTFDAPAMTANQVDGIACTKMAPMQISELAHLSPSQWSHFKSLCINTGNEERSVWVLLNKVKTQFTLYVPEPADGVELLTPAIEAELHKQVPGGVVIQRVDYKINKKLSDIKELNPIAEWHAILFGRVLPGCLSNESFDPLFRQKVPLSLLLQWVFEQCGYSHERKRSLAFAFLNRNPITECDVNQGFSASSTTPILLGSRERLPASISSHVMLKDFDMRRLQLSDDLITLTIDKKDDLTPTVLVEALFSVYHSPLSRLAFPFMQLQNEYLIHKLFEYDVHLRSIQPTLPAGSSLDRVSPGCFEYPLHCAARNRFLESVNPTLLNEAENSIMLRKGLWRTTGKEIASFFYQHGQAIDLDFINDTIPFNQVWHKATCDHLNKPNLAPTQWSFVQIPQMGTEGLGALFQHLKTNYTDRWDALDKEPAPQLPATFDLAGSLTDKRGDYLRALIALVKSFSPVCFPLFSSLHLIVPKDIISYHLGDLEALLSALDVRQKNNPSDLREVSLHGIEAPGAGTLALINRLEKMANNGDLRVLIRIPAWDRDAYDNVEQRELKARYRALQNKILDNQRRVNHAKLPEQTKSLGLAVIGRLDPDLVLDDKLAQKTQLWDGDDVTYPLTARKLGLQQQLQQQEEQQFQQEEEEELEQEQEQDQEIVQFKGDERDLITRGTIDAKCMSDWEAIASDMKALSGWQESHQLSHLFSLWVGSELDAEQVIERIEPSAVKKMMEHAAQFRFGIARDNLPPGFYLANTRTSPRLILCFDEKRQKQDLRTRASLTLKKRNPFTVELHTPQLALEFRGDFRQMSPLAASPKAQQTLWTYLAIEDQDGIRLNNIKTILEPLGIPSKKTENHGSVILQRLDALNDLEIPGEYTHCLKLLTQWAVSRGAEEGLVVALFTEDHRSVMSPQNLKAFGQLFNQYDVQEKGQHGSDHWLLIANQVYKTFGSAYFSIWKNRVLNPSRNWSECLEKAEVDAISLSIVTLKDSPEYQAIWWKLVDMHGRSTGHMHYSHLWYAFQKVLKFVEKNHLTIHQEALFNYLEKTPDINGKVFLDRLYYVLKNTATQLDHRKIQQQILASIDQVDWRHNGVYYASRYEENPYWHQALQLAQFKTSSREPVSTYRVTWDNTSVVEPLTHALRFASQRIKLTINAFERFEHLIRAHFEPVHDHVLSLRLLTSCLALGVDRVSDLRDAEVGYAVEQLQGINPEILTWLNAQWSLDEPLVLGSLQLHWVDMVPFLRVIESLDLGSRLMQLSTPDAREFINGCGRALDCYRFTRAPHAETEFERLLKRTQGLQGPISLHPLLTNRPWILGEQGDDKGVSKSHRSAEFYQQSALLTKQLRSIDFSKQGFLPNAQEIFRAHDAIDEAAPNAMAAVRCDRVTEWMEKGAAIKFHDAPFRQLKSEECDAALRYVNNHLKANFKDRNQVLCERLIREHLAIQADGDVDKQMAPLLNLFMRFDNKTHYDELGQILGLLLAKSKTSYYSVPQLVTWLDSLLDAATFENQHYPVNLLSEILTHAVASQSCGLLNPSMHLLTGKTSLIRQQREIREITRLPLRNQYKPVLVKRALISQTEDDFSFIRTAQDLLLKLHQAGVDPDWMDGVIRLITKFAGEKHALRQRIFTQLSRLLKETPGVDTSLELTELWTRTQVKLGHWFVKGIIEVSELSLFCEGNTPQEAYIRMILVQSINPLSIDSHSILLLKRALERRSVAELKSLASYYATEPHPPLLLLTRLLERSDCASTQQLIHHFESVEQGYDREGQPKRHYSVTEADEKSLRRVLAGFKRKGKQFVDESEANELLNLLFYTNSFSQVASLHLRQRQELTDLLHGLLGELKRAGDHTPERHQNSARVLACMREILLRKSGKWANHTQMLDLLYAALHNDDSLLHQVRTGQGKSIITIMRASYLALTGSVVDVFSAKPSLSKRDHDEFASVLDGMGIEHAYITAGSPAEQYKNKVNAHGIGAVNYATMGDFSLFQSTHAWLGKTAITLNPANRVAFIDEADHVLTDEKTQFNYSDNSDSDAIYNLDEWVYREAYAFYTDKKDSFTLNESGALLVSRNEHLAALCRQLQERVIFAPKQSRFFEKYIIPAVGGDAEFMKKRDQQLMLLLTAAHTADGLLEGVNFCIRPETQIVNGGMVINTRFAKVMIDNQIRHGSTYSDMVQQFLHVRLNKEAAERGQTPDFFVEPVSQIGLSLNAPYLLKKVYRKLEGCTGTAGNHHDLDMYQKQYGIDHVIKLPTHEALRTNHLPTDYCEGIRAQIDAIAADIQANGDRPILITCQDDIEVKKIAGMVREKLGACDYQGFDSFIVDTNDSGKAERDIVPLAGRIGAVTISSRLGRGTDIQPESPLGLMVLRTYPTMPRVSKQERGRQGRNGAAGTCKDIINFVAVQRGINHYKKSPHAKRLLVIIEEQKAHLLEKLDKHRKDGSDKWSWLTESPALQENYVQTRSLQQLKHELKQVQETYLRRKEAVLAMLSGQVLDALRQDIVNRDANGHQQLRKAWLDCSKRIETLWNARLAGQAGDSEAVYQAFFKEADAQWQRLCGAFASLNPLCLMDLVQGVEELPTGLDSTRHYIEKTTRLWEGKKDALVGADESSLTAVRQQLKKIFIACHPDKVGENKAEAEAILQQAGKLNTLVLECLAKIKPSSGLVEYEEMPTPDLSGLDPSMLQMVHVPHPKRTPVVRHQGMSVVTQLYQAYVKGAQTYHFDPRDLLDDDSTLEAIYGDGLEYLDGLYQQLLQASCKDSKAMLVRRQGLYSVLSGLMGAPAIYCISCQSLGDAIHRLMTQLDTKDDAHYVACASAFFNQTWLAEQRPSAITADQVEKTDRLLSLTLDVVTTRYVAEDNATLAFIHHLGDALYHHFWGAFDNPLIDEIKAVLATDPDVTALLMKHTNTADLTYLFDLLLSNSKTRFGVVSRNTLMSYLKQNSRELSENPGLLRPLFRLTLLSGNLYTENYLPEPNDLSHLTPELRGQFWHFLSQRQPYTKSDYDAFVRLLGDRPLSPDFIRLVFNPMMELPPYLSLDYLVKQLKFYPGKTHLDDARLRLKTLEQVGNAFNQFMLSRKLIPSALEFSHSGAELGAAFRQWDLLFTVTSLQKNQIFFDLANQYPLIPLASMLVIAWAYAKADLSAPGSLVSVMALANKLQKLTGDQKDFMYEQFNSALETSKESVDRFSHFVGIIEQSDVRCLDSLKRLFTDFKQTADENRAADLVHADLRILADIDVFEAENKKYPLRQRYLADRAAGVDNQHYLTFLKLAKESKSVVGEAMYPICRAYFEEKSIADQATLADAFAVIAEAQDLQRKKNYNDYFSLHATVPYQQKRQRIMQYLHHGLLKLGQSFSDRCYKEYNYLSSKLADLPTEGLNTAQRSERPDLFRRCFQGIRRFATEMARIVVHPGTVLPTRREEPALGHLYGNYQAYFRSQEKQYASFWWTNHTRKNQAKALFSQLSGRDHSHLSLLRVICQTQKDILDSDIGTTHNSKGYSRLYDISMNMFVTIARDYLADSSIELQQKTQVNVLINQQFNQLVYLLVSRLPFNHELGKYIRQLERQNTDRANQWIEGSTERADLIERLGSLDSKTIPSHLLYIVDSLKGLIELSPQTQPESRPVSCDF